MIDLREAERRAEGTRVISVEEVRVIKVTLLKGFGKSEASVMRHVMSYWLPDGTLLVVDDPRGPEKGGSNAVD